MKKLKLMFLISASAHVVIIGTLLIGVRFRGRKTSPSSYRVQIVEMKKPVEAAQLKEGESVKPVKKKVKLDTSSKKEKDNKKLEERLKKRKKLDELRKKREEELRKEREASRKEKEKLDKWSGELSGRKTLEKPRVDSASVFPSWFINEIHNRIFSVWEVPPAAGNSQARIGFEILRSGEVGSIAVEKGSGNSVFDLSCEEAVRNASPLPSLPGLFKGDKVRVHVTFKEE